MSGQPWEGDVNDAVVEEWKDETTAFERVRDVLQSTTTPQYAGEIAERARVSEPSARTHLNALLDAGLAEAQRVDRGTRFKRSRETLAMQRIRELHSELSRQELTEGIHELKERIRDYEDRFDVSDPDALALELGANDEEWGVIPEWRSAVENLKLAQAALSLYDFDPDGEGGKRLNDGESSPLGSFARDDDGVSDA